MDSNAPNGGADASPDGQGAQLFPQGPVSPATVGMQHVQHRAMKLIATAQEDWLQTQDVLFLLYCCRNAQAKNLLPNPPSLLRSPSPGTLYITTRDNLKTLNQSDGYSWRKKVNSNYVRDDREKLRHDGVPQVVCSYVQGDEATYPELRRRVYWLMVDDDDKSGKFPVVVHYMVHKRRASNKDHPGVQQEGEATSEQCIQFLLGQEARTMQMHAALQASSQLQRHGMMGMDPKSMWLRAQQQRQHQALQANARDGIFSQPLLPLTPNMTVDQMQRHLSAPQASMQELQQRQAQQAAIQLQLAASSGNSREQSARLTSPMLPPNMSGSVQKMVGNSGAATNLVSPQGLAAASAAAPGINLAEQLKVIQLMQEQQQLVAAAQRNQEALSSLLSAGHGPPHSPGVTASQVQGMGQPGSPMLSVQQQMQAAQNAQLNSNMQQ